MSERQSACAVIPAMRLAPGEPVGQRERQRHADQERERRLNQVVQRAADPFHVRLMMAEQLPDSLTWQFIGHAAKLSTSAIIRNITNPR